MVFAGGEICAYINPFAVFEHVGGVALATEVGHGKADGAGLVLFGDTVDNNEKLVVDNGSFSKRERRAHEIVARRQVELKYAPPH